MNTATTAKTKCWHCGKMVGRTRRGYQAGHKTPRGTSCAYEQGLVVAAQMREEAAAAHQAALDAWEPCDVDPTAEIADRAIVARLQARRAAP